MKVRTLVALASTKRYIAVEKHIPDAIAAALGETYLSERRIKPEDVGVLRVSPAEGSTNLPLVYIEVSLLGGHRFMSPTAELFAEAIKRNLLSALGLKAHEGDGIEIRIL